MNDMFNRKQPNGADPMAPKPQTSPASPAMPDKPAAAPASAASDAHGASVARPQVPPIVRRAAEIPSLPSKGERPHMPSENKKLIVGPDISLNGHISSCDRLVVEGRVEVELTDCHTIEISETGVFKGAAEIESAEVSGHYEGSLTVRDHLLIHSTGHVSGTIRYGRLEIQQGGEINGDVRSISAEAASRPLHRESLGSLRPGENKPAVAN